MKDLKEMSDQELFKLREQLDLGDDGTEGDIGELNDQDLIDALSGLTELQEAAPSVKKGAPKSPPKGYPKSKDQYADPTNFKYPLDTEAHVRAALAYFSKAKNRAGYSPQEQKFMWKRIIAATKKYDIELSDDVKKHAEKLGESDSSDGGEVKEELDEKEIIALIDKHIHEQMRDTGQAPNTMEKAGYPPPHVRVPPDIEAINTQLENFKQLHAQHSLNNTDMAAKVSALTKQVNDMNSAFTKMQASFGGGDESSDSTSSTSDSSSEEEEVGDGDGDSGSDDSSDDQNADGGGQQESLAEKAAKEAKAAEEAGEGGSKKEVREASSTSTTSSEEEETPESDSDDEGEVKTKEEKAKLKSKHKKKVKEQMKHAKAQGLTATSDMTSGTGTQPPGFGAGTDEQETEARSFGDVMNKATRQRRRGIGAT